MVSLKLQSGLDEGYLLVPVPVIEKRVQDSCFPHTTCSSKARVKEIRKGMIKCQDYKW